MADSFDSSFKDYDSKLVVSSTTSCKLIIKRELKILCEMDFDSIGGFNNVINELNSLSEQWLAYEEYKAGYREFYIE